MFLYPLWFGKYAHDTFLEVNVICPVVMYTNTVLRPCHMLMLDNALWLERLTEELSAGLRKGQRREQMVRWTSLSLGPQSLLFWTSKSPRLFSVLPFSLAVIQTETQSVDLSSLKF